MLVCACSTLISDQGRKEDGMWECSSCEEGKQSLQVYLFCVVFLCLALAGMWPQRFPHTTAHFESVSESTGYSCNCCASGAALDACHR